MIALYIKEIQYSMITAVVIKTKLLIIDEAQRNLYVKKY